MKAYRQKIEAERKAREETAKARAGLEKKRAELALQEEAKRQREASGFAGVSKKK